MKLHELIEQVTWCEVQAAIIGNYPTFTDNLPMYKKAFGSLLTMVPEESETVISFVPVFDNANIVELRLAGIGGAADRDPFFAMSWTPWGEWLGMKVDDAAVEGMPAAEIVAHCMFEMTALGYEAEHVKRTIKSHHQNKLKHRSPVTACFDLKHGGRKDLMWRRLEFLDEEEDL